MKLQLRARDEKGAVLVIVAIFTLVLLTLSVGGIMMFSVYGANREMQKAADQAALAGAAALPLLRPGVALSSLNLNPVYNLTDNYGLDVPLRGISNVPDPRAVACAYGTTGLAGTSAQLIGKFGSPADPSLGGYCTNAPWSDGRVLPVLNSLSSPISSCLNSLTSRVSSLRTQLLGSLQSNPLINLLLTTLGLPSVNAAVDQVIAPLEGVVKGLSDLEALSPALLTPEMTVTVKSGVKPPMFSYLAGSDGFQMTVQATAQRRLKNAVVLPSTPGLTNVNLNTALAATKPTIMSALGSLNTQLNTLMGAAPGGLGLSGCQNLLDPQSKIVQDIGDIYNPPSGGPNPSGRDLINGATAAANHAASVAGTNVASVAGEAFVVIRHGATPSTISNLVGPIVNTLGLTGLIGSLQIPAMDVALVAAHDLEDGNISNPELIPDVLAARGLFTATLVD